MIRREGQVTDEYDRPVPGATVYVFNEDGTDAALYADDGVTPLADNSVTTDQYGTYSYYAADAVLREDTYYASKLGFKEVFIHGDPPAFVGPAGPGTDLSIHADTQGAVGDGTTPDTAALQATNAVAAASVGRWRILNATYALTGITAAAGTVLATAGLGSTLKQSGAANGTTILTVGGSKASIGDLSVTGQIAANTGEQNPGVVVQANGTTGDIAQVRIGSVYGTDLRGDVVYLGTTTGNDLEQVTVGHIRGSNILRNLLSVVGGRAIEVASVIADGGNGLYVFDLETNLNGGKASGIRIGYAKGQYAGFVGVSAADLVEGADVGLLDLDPSYGTDTTPAYGATRVSGLQIRNTRSSRIGTFLANGFSKSALEFIWNVGELAQSRVKINYARLTGCNTANTAGIGYIQGLAGDHTDLNIDSLDVTLSTTGHSAMAFCNTAILGAVRSTAASASFTALQTSDILIGKLVQTGGIGLSSCTRGVITGGVFNGERLFSNCTGCTAIGMDITASVGDMVGDTSGMLVNCSVGGTAYVVKTATQTWTHAGVLTLPSGGSLAIGSKVVGARKTGWAVDTGTAKRTANATYTVGAAMTVSAAYTQAEIVAMRDRINLLEAAVRDATQTIKALKDDLHATAGHGLIGT